jgi:hypothetical protein
MSGSLRKRVKTILAVRCACGEIRRQIASVYVWLSVAQRSQFAAGGI